MAAAPFPPGLEAAAPATGTPDDCAALAMGAWLACCCALATAWSACSLVRLFVAPHMVHTERYLVPTGMSGMKNSVKKVLTRMMPWAAGEWQTPHMAKTLARR